MVDPERIFIKHMHPAFLDVLDVTTDEIKKLTRVRTGYLRGSINNEETGFFEGVIGTIVEYAVHQEYGTSRIEPVAMFRRGVMSAKPKNTRIVQQAMNVLITEILSNEIQN